MVILSIEINSLYSDKVLTHNNLLEWLNGSIVTQRYEFFCFISSFLSEYSTSLNTIHISQKCAHHLQKLTFYAHPAYAEKSIGPDMKF